jgi:hypothetical protein
MKVLFYGYYLYPTESNRKTSGYQTHKSYSILVALFLRIISRRWTWCTATDRCIVVPIDAVESRGRRWCQSITSRQSWEVGKCRIKFEKRRYYCRYRLDYNDVLLQNSIGARPWTIINNRLSKTTVSLVYRSILQYTYTHVVSNDILRRFFFSIRSVRLLSQLLWFQ